MLNAIVRFSIRFRGIAISLACALLVYGILSLSHVPYDVFPEFAPPEVSIRSEEHTSELQSRVDLVCRLLLEKKKYDNTDAPTRNSNMAPAPVTRGTAHV